ncbi:FeMo cofactor biosynthesis protein NifB [Kyrpidia spormannii]|uniref:FeMo cofactor biosynthesis protein NifB n=2 Tax=Kyrpidia spormannii TaxID=2055160 RepID=A0A6F9E5S1_9BACL|nr:FeMo cofactor biosynthesis protein NifB [Kyrpidia spormannii]CAB3393100.1 FeMo cofactor biosynthesis protein NifB [Kyrpidia spormannii]
MTLKGCERVGSSVSATCGVEGSASRGRSVEGLSESIIEKVKRHPCYSEEAHHFFARMHVAVAPACNIQCKYCNRKYDCMNESRPGVTSELLTPEEATQKVLAVGSVIRNTTVVGIAGPGDPLANPRQTFRTFELIRQAAPDMKLCLSTNGLALPDHVDTIRELGIDHVTITINAVDPEVGQHIYRYVTWQGKLLRGIEAARLLLERQMEGMRELVKAGILIKVNSVLIPGVNDVHMADISAEVRKRGAFLHNIMPLIIADGSDFQKEGRRAALPEDVAAAQERSGAGDRLMRHCRQCRADAVGLLGEDRSGEFTKEKFRQMSAQYDPERRKKLHMELDRRIEKMSAARRAAAANLRISKTDGFLPFRVAVSTSGGNKVNLHFGHTKEFQIYEVSPTGLKFLTARKVGNYCSGIETCGEGEGRIDEIARMIADCRYVLCTRIGPGPKSALEEMGIQVVTGYGPVEQELFRLADLHAQDQVGIEA